MKKPQFTILAIFFIFFAINSNFAQDFENQEEKENFLNAVQTLEENPLDEKAKELRKWAMSYSERIDGPFCFKIASLFYAAEVRGEVIGQYIIKVEAFHLENNRKKYDKDLAQVAALKSALNVYQKVKQADSSATYSKFERLLKIKNEGRLDKFVKSAKCK